MVQHSTDRDRDAELGLLLKLRRDQLGMTQTDLGAQVGRSMGSIQKYEYGLASIKASTLETLATALEVPLSYFFSRPIDLGRSPVPIQPRFVAAAEQLLSLKDDNLKHELLAVIRSLETREQVPPISRA